MFLSELLGPQEEEAEAAGALADGQDHCPFGYGSLYASWEAKATKLERPAGLGWRLGTLNVSGG